MQRINEFSTRDQQFVGFFDCSQCDLQWNQESIEYRDKKQCYECQNYLLPYKLLKVNEALKIDETYTCIFKCVHGIIRMPNCRINQQYIACNQCNLAKFPDQILSNMRKGRKIDSSIYFDQAKFQCSQDDQSWYNTRIKLQESRECAQCRDYYFPIELLRGPSFTEDKRYYGVFQCGDCNKTWSSSSSWLNVSQQCKCSNQFFFPYELRFRNRIIKSTYNQLFIAKFECIDCNMQWEKDQIKYGESDRCFECNELYFPYKLENDDIQFIDDQTYRVKFICQCGETRLQNGYMNTPINCQACQLLIYPNEVTIIEQNRRNLNHIQKKCSKCIRLGYSCMRGQNQQEQDSNNNNDESSQSENRTRGGGGRGNRQ